MISNLLYLLTACFILFVGICGYLKNKTALNHNIFLLFILSLVLWMGALYFGYYFINIPNLSLFFIRLTFGIGACVSSFLLIFIYLYPRKTLSLPKYIEISYALFTLAIVILSSFTNLIYDKEIIVHGSEIEDIHGPLHILFIAHYLLNLSAAVIFSLVKIRTTKNIEKRKMIFVFWGTLSIVLPGLIFHTLLPRFGIYLLQTEVVYFNFIFVALAGYSMIKYRFLDVQFAFTRVIKQGLSIILTVGLMSWIWYGVVVASFIQYEKYFVPLACILSIFLYRYLSFVFIPKLFHRVFGLTSIEFFRESIGDFCSRTQQFSSIEEFQRTLQIFFEEHKIECIGIVSVDRKTQKRYPKLIHYFIQNPDSLVQNERPFLSQEKQQVPNERPENLGYLGEVCIPLFRSQNVLLGFLILGKKEFGDCYSSEEIELLEQFKSYIELRLTGIMYSEHLRQEVDQKTAALKLKKKEIEKAYSQLQTLDEAKDTFLSIASHELRTPMTVIKGFADLLLSDKFGSISNQQKLFLDTISQNTQDLTILVNKMLDISSLEADKMEFECEEIRFPEYLEKIVQEFEVMCQEKHIYVEFKNIDTRNLILQSDPLKLKQIMGNLLGNALKFTPSGGSITVSLERCMKREKCVQISVIDTGIGIPKEEQKRIFEKFYRTKHSSQITCSGTGLGLNIVKLLVEKLGGEIFLVSEKNKGSRFTFLFPECKK